MSCHHIISDKDGTSYCDLAEKTAGQIAGLITDKYALEERVKLTSSNVTMYLKELRRTRAALRLLYNETKDYITRNNLGDPHHNRSMQVARKVLGLQ